MMKTIPITIILACLCVISHAQQEGLHTQFMFNKLAYNPAYAGRFDYTQLTGVYRAQWIGLEGAPNSQYAGLNLPFDQRSGLGVNLARQSETINQRIQGDVMYAYGFPVGPGHLRLGLSVSWRFLQQDFTDPRLIGSQPVDGDPSIPREVFQKSYGNTGLGVYYYTDNYFAGVSVPRLLENDIDFNEEDGTISRERRHLYIMGGAAFDLTTKWTFLPQALIRYVQNAPLNLDLNASMRYDKTLSFGLSYRTGQFFEKQSHWLNALAAWHYKDVWMVGFAYDITLSEIRPYQDGSLELMLQWNIGPRSENNVINQRYF
jgi:type IX secretion system PorP/SprF family membrane protein